MATFVDPRSESFASTKIPSLRLALAPGALTELHRLCRDNRLYDIERWIQMDRPLQLSPETAVCGELPILGKSVIRHTQESVFGITRGKGHFRLLHAHRIRRRPFQAPLKTP